MAQARDLDRMLLWFKAQLPRHELGYWRFEEQPHARCLINEDTRVIRNYERRTISMLRGWASCVRCGKTFELEQIGNFALYAEEDEERLARDYPTLSRAAIITKAKEWLHRQAERDGECWGDVPDVERNDWPAVVMDHVSAS